MAELQLITNATGKLDLPATFDLPQNYSILINKMEELALGLDSVFGNLSLDRKAVDIAIGSDLTSSSTGSEVQKILDVTSLLAADRARSPHNVMADEVHLTRVVSDVWIGVILTLLMTSVVFFICACFLYHKFQQWKNSYRTSHNQAAENCRRYPGDFAEAESLPSYTIVSGLPSYDDALEEFRKAGILLTSPTPMIKIFSDTKNADVFNIEEAAASDGAAAHGSGAGVCGDSISMTSTCTCSGSSANSNQPQTPTANNSMMNLCLPNGSPAAAAPPQIIELTPEQLASLSQKRLSLQIAFNSSLHRTSRSRVDLYRAANRNNHLRSRALTNSGLEPPLFPTMHRSTSTSSLSTGHQRIQQHRGSLC